MKITEHIANANGKTLFSFELIPPLKGQSIQGIYDAIDPLMEFKPPFIDVTSLREDYIYKEHENGLLEKLSYRKRPGTIAICAAIMNKYKVDTVPHLLCGGFTKDETENGLFDLQFLGIENVLVLRGDARRGDASFIPTPNGHNYATDLLQQVVDMNNGIYLHEHAEDNLKTDFCIGIAGYPEKHFEAPNMKTDFKYLKKKLDMGAGFIVTQMFFDNQKYFDFVNRCRAEGITIPIIPGLKVLATRKQLDILPKLFYLDMPEAFRKEVIACETDKQAKQLGIEWCVQQCRELIDFGVHALHFYNMSKYETTLADAKNIY